MRTQNIKWAAGRPISPEAPMFHPRHSAFLGFFAAVGPLFMLNACISVRGVPSPPSFTALSSASSPDKTFAAPPVPDGQAEWLAREARAESFDAQRLETAVFDAANAFRKSHGLPALRFHLGLARAARGHSDDMARRDYFSHRAPGADGHYAADRLKLEGVSFSEAGENLALEPCVRRFWTDGRLEYNTWLEVAENSVKHWADSPGHRANLLNANVSETGLGVALTIQNGRPHALITQVFRRP